MIKPRFQNNLARGGLQGSPFMVVVKTQLAEKWQLEFNWHRSNGWLMFTKPINKWTGSAVGHNRETFFENNLLTGKNRYLNALSAGLVGVCLATLSRSSQISTSSYIKIALKRLLIIVLLKYFHSCSKCFYVCSTCSWSNYLLKPRGRTANFPSQFVLPTEQSSFSCLFETNRGEHEASAKGETHERECHSSPPPLVWKTTKNY